MHGYPIATVICVCRKAVCQHIVGNAPREVHVETCALLLIHRGRGGLMEAVMAGEQCPCL